MGQGTWILFGTVERHRQLPCRSEVYIAAKQVSLRTQDMKAWCRQLSVCELYYLVYVSQREAPEAVHRLNSIFIRKALFAKGFTRKPGQSLVFKVPPNGRLHKSEINKLLRRMLLGSHMPRQLAMAEIWDMRVVYTARQTLGETLGTTKQWLRKGRHSASCMCHLYSADWPRRHGHICVPSWNYTGPFQDTMRSLMTCKVIPSYDSQALYKALVQFWMKRYPSALLKTVPTYLASEPAQIDSPLTYFKVSLLLGYLRNLVTMGIDKCKGRVVLVCPVLLWKLFDSAFPVESDVEHFADVGMCVPVYMQWLKGKYKSNRWDLIGGWYNGDFPEPYTLFKLKDLIRPCRDVLQEKGKCCRQRPISPNTKHPLRVVYKRIGSVLRLLCLNMPSNSITFLRGQDLLNFIHSWNGMGEGDWMLITGDVANCYDELVYTRILDAIRWALASLPKWSNKRVCDRFSVSKANRKDVSIGPDYVGDRINLTAAQVLQVCDFDCNNSVMFVDGKLRRRLLGAPMGGFLSAFCAILSFALIEYQCIQPMFKKMGIPGGIKRYLDDVIAAFLCKSHLDKQKCKEFVLRMAEAYPHPLKLNLTEFGDQDYLETRVFVSGGRLKLRLQNLVIQDQRVNKEPYRARLTKVAGIPIREVQSRMNDIALRAIQNSSDYKQLSIALVELQAEARNLPKLMFHQTIRYLRSRYGKEKKVMKAIAKGGW